MIRPAVRVGFDVGLPRWSQQYIDVANAGRAHFVEGDFLFVGLLAVTEAERCPAR